MRSAIKLFRRERWHILTARGPAVFFCGFFGSLIGRISTGPAAGETRSTAGEFLNWALGRALDAAASALFRAAASSFSILGQRGAAMFSGLVGVAALSVFGRKEAQKVAKIFVPFRASLRPVLPCFLVAAGLLLSGCASDGGVHVATTFPLGRDGQLGSLRVDVGYFPPADFRLAPPDSRTFAGGK